MTDEINQPEQQQPIEAEIVPHPTSHRLPSVLSTLPKEILQELETRIQTGESVKFIREDMLQKHPTVEELKVSYLSWAKYARKLKGGTQKELREGTVVKKEMIAALPSAEDLQKAVSTVINPSVDLKDKEAVLTALYSKEMQRLAILEARQKNFIDPDVEALMIGYLKEVRALLETVTKLQEVLQKDTLSSFRSELDELIRTILTTVYAAYKLNHADTDSTSKFDGFKADLEFHLAKTLQAYSQKPS